jgi:hypothetical protein
MPDAFTRVNPRVDCQTEMPEAAEVIAPPQEGLPLDHSLPQLLCFFAA